MPIRHRFGILWLSVAACACGGGSNGQSGQSSPTSPTNTNTPATTTAPGLPNTLTLHASPIALNAIRWITPLGNMNPTGGHTLPTDHIYFYFANPDINESPVARRTDFFAPADGVIEDTYDSVGGDKKLRILGAPGVYYYVDHLIPSVPIASGTRVTSGQRLGTTGSVFAIDLGVVNYGLTLMFLNPPHYNDDTLHADAPLKYYEEPVRSQLYGLVQRIGGEKDGRITYDVAGTMSGNWYEDDMRTGAPMAFAYDTYDPSQVRVSIGTFVNERFFSGVFGIAPGEPAPRDVSLASGIVRYTLIATQSGTFQTGAVAKIMLAQVTAADRMQVEFFDPAERPTAFTSNAKRFRR